MNSRQLQSHAMNESAQPSRTNSNPLSNPISAQLQEAFGQKPHLNLQKIQIMQEGKLAELGQYLEHNIYKKLLEKVTKHLLNAMQRQRVLEPNDKFNEERFMDDLNNCIKNSVDRFDVWINYNILRRQDVINIKKAILEREEKKRQKYAQIDTLMAKIIEKQKDKKAQEIIENFRESRRTNYVRFASNPEIDTYKEKINRALNRKPDHADIEFQKAEEKIKAYKKKSQSELGFNFTNRFDEIKLF